MYSRDMIDQFPYFFGDVTLLLLQPQHVLSQADFVSIDFILIEPDATLRLRVGYRDGTSFAHVKRCDGDPGDVGLAPEDPLLDEAKRVPKLYTQAMGSKGLPTAVSHHGALTRSGGWCYA